MRPAARTAASNVSGQVIPDGGGRPYNAETATDPRHTRTIDFESCGQKFALALEIPLYIWEKLTNADWDQVEKWVRDRADQVRLTEAAAGNVLRWKQTLEDFARKCVYNQFSKLQVA